MGKIRVSTLGDQDAEKKQKDEAKQRRLVKKAAKEGTKGAAKEDGVKETKKPAKPAKATKKEEVKKTEAETPEPRKVPAKPKKVGTRLRSPRYKEIRSLVDPRKLYALDEALVLLKQTSKTKFTGSVEAHFNLSRVVKIKNANGVKVERKSPLAHAKIGKTTDTDSLLKEKLAQAMKVLGTPNIKKLVLNATMGPGIKIQL